MVNPGGLYAGFERDKAACSFCNAPDFLVLGLQNLFEFEFFTLLLSFQLPPCCWSAPSEVEASLATCCLLMFGRMLVAAKLELLMLFVTKVALPCCTTLLIDKRLCGWGRGGRGWMVASLPEVDFGDFH